MTPKPRPLRTPRTSHRAQAVTLGFVLVILVAALAGCVADDPVSPGDEEGQTGPDAGEGGVTEDGDLIAAAHRFADGDRVELQIDESGTFALNEYCWPAGCLQEELTGEAAHERRFDVTEEIPVGVPATLMLDLVYDQDNLGTISVRVETEDVETFHLWHEVEHEREQIRATLVRTGPDATVQIVVEAAFPGPPAESSWSLTGGLVVEPDRIVSSVPVLVPVEGDTTELLVSTRDGEGEGEFLVWDDDDDYVGRFRTEDGRYDLTLPAPARGEFVFVVLEDSASIQVSATGASPKSAKYRALPVTWIAVGDPHDPEQGATSNWEFDIDTMPLAVAVAVEGELYTNNYMETQVDSPKGTVLDGSIACGGCISYSMGGSVFWAWSSIPGHPNHAEGRYQASVDLVAGADFHLQAYSIIYER